MHALKNPLLLAALTLVAAAAAAGANSSAQVAGGTARNATLAEVPAPALGKSVMKSLLGKAAHSGAGEKVGVVQDLIITPDKSVAYLIIGVGGFFGMGRHDVAIPVAQVQDLDGKLVIVGASKDSIKAMPAFDYANDEQRRNEFAGRADKDIAAANLKLADIEKKASAASAETKAKLEVQAISLKQDLKAAEAKLVELRQASAARWRSFEADASAAIARLRKAIDNATG